MKKLFTLLSAIMLVFALGANAQSRKTWDFTKGVSDATRAALDADDATWGKTVDQESGVSTEWKTNVKFTGELTAGGNVIPEFAGLKFSDFGANNAVIYMITKFRLQKAATVTIPALKAGQQIAISAQSAKSTAEDRGFVFENAADADGKSTILVPGPEGTKTINDSLSRARADVLVEYLTKHGVTVRNSVGLGAKTKESNRLGLITLAK